MGGAQQVALFDLFYLYIKHRLVQYIGIFTVVCVFSRVFPIGGYRVGAVLPLDLSLRGTTRLTFCPGVGRLELEKRVCLSPRV